MEGNDKEEFKQIADFIPFYPALTDPEFSYNIARKKEFGDYALTSKYTEIPGLFRQQVIIQRFLSPETLYNELLIFHQVGAGKTATAFAVAESWKTQARETDACAPKVFSASQCPLIIVRNVDRFTPIFEKELRDRFPVYNSPDATFAKNYEIESHRRAGKKGDYSNRVIIIDEAHNLQPQSKADGGTDYKNILAKLRGAVNSKKILLTGTPILDQARQIIPLMNLILPDPIPTNAYTQFEYFYFKQKIFIPESKNSDDSRYDLTRQLKGRVSFFKTIIPSIIQDKQGKQNVKILAQDNNIITIGTTVPVVCNVMSNFQYTQANQSFLEPKSNQEAFSQTARREATMAFKDPESKTQDRKDFLKTLSNPKIKSLVSRMKPTLGVLKEYSATFHAIIQDIRAHPDNLFFVYLDYVNGAGGQVNFGYILEHFLNYAELGTSKQPRGSRKYAILGFQRKFSSGKSRMKKLRRGTFQQNKQMGLSDTKERLESAFEVEEYSRKILRLFNSAENIKGKYIHVLIGGQKSGEGITIKNVTRVHLIPYWNFGKAKQAIGRTIRPTSHNALIEAHIREKIGGALNLKDVTFEFPPLLGLTQKFTLKCPRGEEKQYERWVNGIPNFMVKGGEGNNMVVEWTGTIEVSAFHHVAVGPPPPPEPNLYRITQDVRVFCTATEKYGQTAQVLQFLKEISFDCPLTYPRNMAAGGENYQCDGFPAEEIDKKADVWKYSIPPDRIQYDTYDLFYTNQEEIIKTLAHLFAENSILSLQQILEKLKVRPNPILGALQSMISRNISLKNRFGFRCCLREDRDMYFLVEFRDAFRDDQTYDQAIYSALPFVTYQTTLQDLNDFQLLEARDSVINIQNFCADPLDFQAFQKLSLQTRIRLLEEFYQNGVVEGAPPFIAKLLKNVYEIEDEKRDKVAVHVMFAKFHTEVGSGYKTKLKSTGEMRVLGPDGWRYAFPDEEEKYLPSIIARDK